MVDYDPFSDAILDDPFPVYSRLRAESPVLRVASTGRTPAISKGWPLSWW